jgi:hypothetical protein
MYAQIDFNRASEHEIYTRIKFYDPSYCKLGASLSAISLVEMYEKLTIELSDLVSESFITEEGYQKVMAAYEDICRTCGHGWYLDLHIEESSVSGTDLLERIRMRVLDEDDRKDIPLAGVFVRQLTVDVQI